MIKITELPFHLHLHPGHYSSVNVQAISHLFEYEEYCVVGNVLHIDKPWKKYRLSLSFGKYIIEHTLIALTDEYEFGQVNLYPIYTNIKNIPTTNKLNDYSLLLIHKKGIEEIFRIQQNKSIVLESFMEHILHMVKGYLEDTLETSIYISPKQDEHVRNILNKLTVENTDNLTSILNGCIQELISNHYADIRYEYNQHKFNFSDICLGIYPLEDFSAIIPDIPIELDLSLVSKYIINNAVITPTILKCILRNQEIDIDKLKEEDDVIYQKLLMSDISVYMDDYNIYPELCQLYRYFITHQSNELHFKLSPKDNILTNKLDQDALNFYNLFINTQLYKDLSMDLISLECNECVPYKDSTTFGTITEIEVIYYYDSACIIIYSDVLSCTIHLDITIGAILSPALLSVN